MNRGSQRIVEIGGLLVVLLVPLAFNPLQSNAFEPLKATLFQVITLLMALAVVIAPFGRAAGPDNPGSGSPSPAPRLVSGWPYLALAAAIALATIFAADVQRSLWTARPTADGTLTWLSGVLFCWLLGQALSKQRQATRLTRALVIGSAPVTVYGLIQAAGLDPLVWISDSVSPVLSTVGRSNYLAAYLVMVMPFTLALGLGGHEGRPAPRMGLLLALQLICLLLTLARAAWLGLLLGVLAAGAALAWRQSAIQIAGLRRRWWLAGGLAVCLVGGGVLYAMSTSALLQPAAYGMRPAVYAQLRADSAAARLVFWRTSLRLLAGHWLLGYGPGAFGAVIAAAGPPELAAAGPAAALLDDPHNLWLDRLLQTGIVGLSAYLALLLTAARRWLHAWRGAADRQALFMLAAVLAALIAYLVQAQVTPNVLTPDALFWTLLALIAGL